MTSGLPIRIQYTTVCTIDQNSVHFVHSTPQVVMNAATPDADAVVAQLRAAFEESPQRRDDGVPLDQLTRRLRAAFPNCHQLGENGAHDYVEKLLREGESKSLCYKYAGAWKPRSLDKPIGSNSNFSSFTSPDLRRFLNQIQCTVEAEKKQQAMISGVTKESGNVVVVPNERTGASKPKQYKRQFKTMTTTQSAVDNKPGTKISVIHEDTVVSEGVPLTDIKGVQDIQGKNSKGILNLLNLHKSVNDVKINTLDKNGENVDGKDKDADENNINPDEKPDQRKYKRHFKTTTTTQKGVDDNPPTKMSLVREELIESIGIPLSDVDFTTTRAGTEAAASDGTMRKIPRQSKATSRRKVSRERIRRRPKMDSPAIQAEVKKEVQVADEKPMPVEETKPEKKKLKSHRKKAKKSRKPKNTVEVHEPPSPHQLAEAEVVEKVAEDTRRAKPRKSDIADVPKSGPVEKGPGAEPQPAAEEEGEAEVETSGDVQQGGEEGAATGHGGEERRCRRCRRWRQSAAKRNLIEIITSLLREEEQEQHVVHCLCADCLPGSLLDVKCRQKMAQASVSEGSAAPTQCTKHVKTLAKFIP